MTETAALDGAITPAAAAAKLQSLGIHVSERTLRERARALGACRIIGKAMFLLPSDIEAILEAARPVPRVRDDRPRWTDVDTDKLIERIQNQNKQRSKAAKKTRTKRIICSFSDAFVRGMPQLAVMGPAAILDLGDKRRLQINGISLLPAGVVAWVRDADPAIGEYGPPRILYQSGEIPELE